LHQVGTSSLLMYYSASLVPRCIQKSQDNAHNTQIACISVMTCIEIGYRNNFITHSVHAVYTLVQ